MAGIPILEKNKASKLSKSQLLDVFREHGAKRYSHLNKAELVKHLVDIRTGKSTWEQFSLSASPRNRTRKECRQYKKNDDQGKKASPPEKSQKGIPYKKNDDRGKKPCSKNVSSKKKNTC